MSRDLIYPFFNTSGNISLLCFVLKKVLVDRNRLTNKLTTIKKTCCLVVHSVFSLMLQQLALTDTVIRIDRYYRRVDR